MSEVLSPSSALGQYNASAPTTADGKAVPLQTDVNGNLKVTGTGSGGSLGFGYSSSATFNRTNDTNAYLANDVVGAATGATAALTFANIGPALGGEVFITTVKLEIDIAAVVSGMTSFVLYTYSVTPPSALGDNAPFDLPSGDRTAFLQPISLGSPVDLGATLAVVSAQINQQISVPVGGSLFAYLVTVGAWTPAASSPFKIVLKSVGI